MYPLADYFSLKKGEYKMMLYFSPAFFHLFIFLVIAYEKDTSTTPVVMSGVVSGAGAIAQWQHRARLYSH